MNQMTSIKFNKILKASETARYPLTFRARLSSIPAKLIASLTSAQIAAVIDGPMQSSYNAGLSVYCGVNHEPN